MLDAYFNDYPNVLNTRAVSLIDKVGLVLSLCYPHIPNLFYATSIPQIERVAVVPLQDQPTRCTPNPVVGL